MINDTRFQKNSILSSGFKMTVNPVNFAFYLMIFFEIFNTNKFVAAIRFTLIPTIIALICCIFFGRRKNSEISMWSYFPLIIICVITAFTTLFSDVVSWTNNVTAFYIYFVLFVSMTWNEFSSEQIKKFFKFHVFLCLIISVGIFVSYLFGINYSFGRPSFNWLGVIKDQNILSAYLSFGVFLLFASYLFNNKKKSMIGTCVILIAILLSGSRAGLLTSFLSGFFLLIAYLKYKESSSRKMFVVLGLFFLIGLFLLVFSSSEAFSRVLSVENYRYDGRLDLWREGMEAFRRNPFWGSGYDSGSFYSAAWYNCGSPTHSSYVDILTSVGIIGSIFFVIFIIKLLNVIKTNRTFLFSMFVALFLPHAFVNGYGTITFMMPLVHLFICSVFCKKYIFNNLII